MQGSTICRVAEVVSSRCLLMCRPTVSSQANYEKSVFNKTNRTIARSEGARRLYCTIPEACSRCSVQPSSQGTLLNCCCRLAAEITMFDDVIVVYKFIGDLMFFVTGSQDENELILYQVLQGFYEAISLLLR